ncbi:MAG: hypothetical protein V8S95_04790 [Odoribacter sp.]
MGTVKTHTIIPIEACKHFKLKDLYLLAGLYINAPYIVGAEYMVTDTTFRQLSKTTGVSINYIKDSFMPKLKKEGYRVDTIQESYKVKRNRYYLPNPSENYRIIWAELFSDNSLSPEEKGFMIGLYCICANNTFRFDLPDKAIYKSLNMVKNTYSKYRDKLIGKGVLKPLGESYIALINFNFFHGSVLMYPHLGYNTYLDILESYKPEKDERLLFFQMYQSA